MPEPRIEERRDAEDGERDESAREVVAGGGSRLGLEVVVVHDVEPDGRERGEKDAVFA